jgi:hypothetical protein
LTAQTGLFSQTLLSKLLLRRLITKNSPHPVRGLNHQALRLQWSSAGAQAAAVVRVEKEQRLRTAMAAQAVVAGPMFIDYSALPN